MLRRWHRAVVVFSRNFHAEITKRIVSVRSNWLEQEFQLRIRLSGLLLVVAYAFVFWAVRQISVDQWVLSAGVRVGALLLFAPRYWPYLIAGEYAAFAYMRYPLIERFGLAWVTIGSAALMPTAAFIVHQHRRLMASGNPYGLLSIAALTAISITALNLGLAWLLMPTRHTAVSWDGAITYVIGDYLGILIFAPLVMLWKHRNLSIQFSGRWRLDVIAALAIIVLLGVYAMLLPEAEVTAKNSLRILMILPAIALTCLHGWQGGAVGVVALNLVFGFTMERTGVPGSHDPNAFVVQEILAMAGTALMLLGSTVSHFYYKFIHRDQIERHTLTLARANLLATERELREGAAQIKLLGEDMDNALHQAVKWLRERGHNAAAMEMLRSSVTQSQLFREQLSLIYPSGIEHYGLYLVLQSSGITGVWDQSDRLTPPHLSGNPCRLSLGLQLAAYRSICDAVAILLEQEKGAIRIRARCGRMGAHQGIVINVSLLDRVRTLSPRTAKRAVDSLTGRALIYGGTVRCRRNHIRLLFIEPHKAAATSHRVPSGASIDQMIPPFAS